MILASIVAEISLIRDQKSALFQMSQLIVNFKDELLPEYKSKSKKLFAVLFICVN